MAHDQEHTAPSSEKNEIRQGTQQDIGKDEAGREAAREYDRDAKKFSESGKVDEKAKEAEEALEGSEGEELKKAERIGKDRAKNIEPGGKR